MVEVEQRPLRAFEQHVLAAEEGGLDEPRRVVEVVAQAVAPGGGLVDQRVDARTSRRPMLCEHQVLVGKRAFDPLAQDVRGR